MLAVGLVAVRSCCIGLGCSCRRSHAGTGNGTLVLVLVVGHGMGMHQCAMAPRIPELALYLTVVCRNKAVAGTVNSAVADIEIPLTRNQAYLESTVTVHQDRTPRASAALCALRGAARVTVCSAWRGTSRTKVHAACCMKSYVSTECLIKSSKALVYSFAFPSASRPWPS